MSQPDGVAAPHGRPLRVLSERLTAEEAERTRATPSVTRFASHSVAAERAAADRATADRASAAPTTVLPVVHDTAAAPVRPAPAPVLASALPVLAPRRPRRRVAELVRLVFTRRHAGRHRPDTTPLQCWSMAAPPRRRPRRWGRR